MKTILYLLCNVFHIRIVFRVDNQYIYSDDLVRAFTETNNRHFLLQCTAPNAQIVFDEVLVVDSI